jgi:hypothetical protein
MMNAFRAAGVTCPRCNGRDILLWNPSHKKWIAAACQFCAHQFNIEQLPTMKCSILESAEGYAHEWTLNELFKNPQVVAEHIAWIESMNRHFGAYCSCTGGLPMMKPDCPRHGKLVRNAEMETRA